MIAAWAYFSASQYTLGLRPEMDALRIDPCTPRVWGGFTATCRLRGKTIGIEIANPRRACRGMRTVTLNGEALPGRLAPAADSWSTTGSTSCGGRRTAEASSLSSA